MDYENRMEQHYAVSKDGVLVHINEAHESSEDCFCPHCGCRMLKRCGKIRTWHFAHDYRFANEVNKECSYESYLHSFAKLRLKQWFEGSKNIILHYQQPVACRFVNDCIWKQNGDECSRIEERTIDLKRCLTHCTLEETVLVDGNRFRADLLWSNPQKPQNDILVEVKVTHECTQKKKDSKKRIIEFEVHSEEDVESIVANDIRESEIVSFYGFSPKDIIDENTSAKYSLSKFIYYRTGKAHARSECNCQTFRNRRVSSLLEVTIKNTSNYNLTSSQYEWQGSQEPFSFGRFYNWGLALAKSKGLDVKNCYLCTHHHYDFDQAELSCEAKPDTPCEAVSALSCGQYQFDEDYYHKNLDEFLKFSQKTMVNLWCRAK